MKPSSLRLALASTLSLIGLQFAAHADVVVMKDGKKYESATILSETADSVTFKYMLTPRIPDTRTEPKASIAQIVKQRPEELAIVPLRKLLPSEDLLTADKYEAIIQDQLRPFVSQYPGTAEAKEVEGIIATYDKEKVLVTGGQLKMDGQWLTPEMVKRETRNIEAYRIRKAMNAAAEKKEWTAALAEWDKLDDRAEGFQDTEQYVLAAAEVSKILDGYKAVLDRMISEQPALQKHRQEATKGLVGVDLTRTTKAIKDEEDKFKSVTELEKKTRVHWMTVYKYDIKTLQAAAKAVVDERAAVASLDLTKLKAVAEEITKARRYYAEQNVEMAEAAVVKAGEAGGRSLSGVSPALTKLKSDISKLKAELSKKKGVNKIYGNASALTGATTETDDRVAKAMEDAAKAKSEKKDAKEGAQPGLTAGSKSGGVKATSETKSKARSSSSDDDATATASDEGGITKYLVMGGGALLVILLGLMFMKKK